MARDHDARFSPSSRLTDLAHDQRLYLAKTGFDERFRTLAVRSATVGPATWLRPDGRAV